MPSSGCSVTAVRSGITTSVSAYRSATSPSTRSSSVNAVIERIPAMWLHRLMDPDVAAPQCPATQPRIPFQVVRHSESCLTDWSSGHWVDCSARRFWRVGTRWGSDMLCALKPVFSSESRNRTYAYVLTKNFGRSSL